MDQRPRYQVPHSAFSNNELDGMLGWVKNHLRDAKRETAVQQEQDRPLQDGTYVISENDIRGLICYILDMADQLRKDREAQLDGTAPTDPVVGPSSSLAPRSMCPVASRTVDPATTFTVSEATFTPAVDADDEGRQRAQTATTKTVVSGNTITQITWLKPTGSASAKYSEVEASSHSPSSPGTPNTADQTQMARPTSSADKPATPQPGTSAVSDNPSEVPVNDTSRSEARNKLRKKRQKSVSVLAGIDEPDPEEAAQPEEEPDHQPTTVLGKMRRKSVQFGQAVGSFLNGAYRNADHKPRRDSSVVRMRGILDRLEPSRPKPEENMAIYTAFTGARAITPVDQYNSRTRRPGPPGHTCSEDGRRHQCVQHEADTPPG